MSSKCYILSVQEALIQFISRIHSLVKEISIFRDRDNVIMGSKYDILSVQEAQFFIYKMGQYFLDIQ